VTGAVRATYLGGRLVTADSTGGALLQRQGG
jgi:hypothetical protein